MDVLGHPVQISFARDRIAASAQADSILGGPKLGPTTQRRLWERGIVEDPGNILVDSQCLGRIEAKVYRGGERFGPTDLILMYRQPVVWTARREQEVKT